MLNKKAIVTKGTFKGVTVMIEDTDINRIGKPWYEHLVPASMVYMKREETDHLPEEGTVYCGYHLDGQKEGLSDLFHESEIEFLTKDENTDNKPAKGEETEFMKMLSDVMKKHGKAFKGLVDR